MGGKKKKKDREKTIPFDIGRHVWNTAKIEVVTSAILSESRGLKSVGLSDATEVRLVTHTHTQKHTCECLHVSVGVCVCVCARLGAEGSAQATLIPQCVH